MSNFQQVLDLFAGPGGLAGLLIPGVLGLWVRHRRNERRYEEGSRRDDRCDRELAMIERAAFNEPQAVEALARLLPMSSLPDRPTKRSATEAGEGQEDDTVS